MTDRLEFKDAQAQAVVLAKELWETAETRPPIVGVMATCALLIGMADVLGLGRDALVNTLLIHWDAMHPKKREPDG